MIRTITLVCVLLALGLAKTGQTADRECGLERGNSFYAPDYDNLPQPADVPEAWRFLAGAPWGFGAWDGVRCYTIALQSVADDGKTALVYGASGAFAGWNAKAGFWNMTVSLLGENTFGFTAKRKREVTYKFTRKGDVLHGESMDSNGKRRSTVRLAQTEEHAVWNVSRAGECETQEPDIPRTLSVSVAQGVAEDLATIAGLWKGQVLWTGPTKIACTALAVRSISENRFVGTYYWGSSTVPTRHDGGSRTLRGSVERTLEGITLTASMPSGRKLKYVLTDAGLEHSHSNPKGRAFGILARVKDAAVESAPTTSIETSQPLRFRDSR